MSAGARVRGLLVRSSLCGWIAVAAGCATSGARATELERAFAERPNDVQVNLSLGRASEQSGQWLKAVQYYERAEALGADRRTLLPRILSVLVAGQRYGEALDRARLYLSEFPEDRPTRFVEAALLVALERPREAEKSLGVLLKAQPDDAEAHFALGQLYRDLGDRRQARHLLSRYLELAPTGSHAREVRFALLADPRLELPADGASESLGGLPAAASAPPAAPVSPGSSSVPAAPSPVAASSPSASQAPPFPSANQAPRPSLAPSPPPSPGRALGSPSPQGSSTTAPRIVPLRPTSPSESQP